MARAKRRDALVSSRWLISAGGVRELPSSSCTTVTTRSTSLGVTRTRPRRCARRCSRSCAFASRSRSRRRDSAARHGRCFHAHSVQLVRSPCAALPSVAASAADTTDPRVASVAARTQPRQRSTSATTSPTPGAGGSTAVACDASLSAARRALSSVVSSPAAALEAVCRCCCWVPPLPPLPPPMAACAIPAAATIASHSATTNPSTSPRGTPTNPSCRTVASVHSHPRFLTAARSASCSSRRSGVSGGTATVASSPPAALAAPPPFDSSTSSPSSLSATAAARNAAVLATGAMRSHTRCHASRSLRAAATSPSSHACRAASLR
mmetsp:Transcript_3738/g.11775  ORF Transcript_3738/g.11775 Transcript_3738/m.11775 type:complete len:323 (-) Transcript_3738:2984-3952(-)